MSHCAVNTKAIKCLMRSILIEKEEEMMQICDQGEQNKAPCRTSLLCVDVQTYKQIIFEIVFLGLWIALFSPPHCFPTATSITSISIRDNVKWQRMLQRKNRASSGRISMPAGLLPLFPNLSIKHKKISYLFWMSEAKSKPLPFSGGITSCVSHCNFPKQSSNED